MLAAVAVAGVVTLMQGLPASETAGVRVLVVQYADGRRTLTPLSVTSSYTHTFPRIAEADTSRDGLPLFAMQYEKTLEAGGVAVTVALLYGRPDERRVPVATVHLKGAEPARVKELEAFGIQPVTFSLTEIPPARLSLPSVTTPSSNLETFVETVTDPSPALLVTIVNHGARDVMMIHFTSYRGKSPGVTGRPRAPRRLPLIGSGEAYVLTLRASTVPGRDGVPVWIPVDRIVIDSVLWSDDVVEGDGVPAADEHALDAGTALQLDRVLTLLRAAEKNPASRAPADLRADIAALTLVVTSEEAETAAAVIPGSVHLSAVMVSNTMGSGMRNARTVVLRDFDEMLTATPSPALSDYAGWLARTIANCDGWRRRIGP